MALTGVGEVIVTALQGGNTNFEVAPNVGRSFIVSDPAKTDQLITFNLPSVVYINDETIELDASSDAGLDITFEIITGNSLLLLQERH